MKKTLLVASLIATMGLYADDGLLDSSESTGSINVDLYIAPQIKIEGLDDFEFTDIDSQGTLLESYEETKKSSFCIYSNSVFVLKVEPQYGDSGMMNATYTSTGSGPTDNIPVTYELFQNQISEGTISGEPVGYGSPFTGNYQTPYLYPNLEIMNVGCKNEDLETVDNYILEGTVYGSDIKYAAAGNYSAIVVLRATVMDLGAEGG